MQPTLREVGKGCREFVFRHFDFKISIRSSRQFIIESGVQKRPGSYWQKVGSDDINLEVRADKNRKELNEFSTLTI